jgi:PAS domain S-box-containing protein
MCPYFSEAISMKTKTKTKEELAKEVEELRARLQAVEESLQAVEKQNKELLATNKPVHSILDQSTEVIIVCDQNGQIVRTSQVAHRFFPGKLLGKPFDSACTLSIASPSPLQPKNFSISSVLSGKVFRAMEVTHRRDDTQEVYFLMSAKALTHNGKGVLGCVVSLTDITERKRAEEALRGSEERLKRAEEIANLGSWELNLVHNRLTWSDEVYRIFGLRPQEFGATYEAFLERVHPDDRAAVDAAYSNSLRENRDSYDIEHRVVWNDTGDIRVVQEKCQHFRDRTGKIIRSVGMVHDITERKRAEHSLRQAKDELEVKVRERTADLQQANERLKEENEERIRTEQSLRIEEARLDALLHLSQISEAPLKEITGFTLEQAIGLTHSKIGFVGFLNEDESVYTLHAVSKGIVKECNVIGDPMQWHVLDAGIWADAIRERRTLFVNDYSQPHPRKKGFPPGHSYVERFMVVPVLEGKRVVALAGVGNKASEYNRSDERQIVLLLSGMWGYLHKSRSREELKKAYNELEEKNEALQAEIAERKRTEEALRKLTNELNERVKEINCLYSVSYSIEKKYAGMEEKLQNIVYQIPSGWQYPEIACARITFKDKEYRTENFEETPWRQASQIIVDGEETGTVEVYYLKEKPEAEEGPFTKEERSLINAIAVALGEMIGHMQADEAVKAERQRFNDALEMLPVYLVLLTSDHHVPFANRFFRERFGESHGRRCFEYLFGRSEPCDICETYTVLKTMAPHEWEWKGPDGRNYHVFDLPFIDSDGSTLILEMGIDITERKQAEEALKTAQQYNRSLIEASLDPLVTISPDGKVMDVNEATEIVTGVTRGRLIGSDFSDYFTEPNKAREGYQRVFSKGFVKDYPLAIRHTSGKNTDVLYHATVLRSKAGEVQGVFAAARDVTERKRVEQALRNSEDRLRYLSSQLLTAQENERKRISRELHDSLGQSLSAIKFKVDDITQQMRQSRHQKIAESLETILPIVQASIEECRRIRMDLRPSILDDLGILATLSWFCRNFETTYSHIHIEKRINIREEEVATPLKTVIYRISQEAFHNTAKHSKGDSIVLSLRKMEEKIELMIEDNGIGFDPGEILSLDSSERGLGLNSMRERTELSGGTFVIASTQGKGTRVNASWPLP